MGDLRGQAMDALFLDHVVHSGIQSQTQIDLIPKFMLCDHYSQLPEDIATDSEGILWTSGLSAVAMFFS